MRFHVENFPAMPFFDHTHFHHEKFTAASAPVAIMVATPLDKSIEQL